ncbi:hypothetical protein DRN38_08315, partial [Thermococci archaeon]
PGTWNIFEVQSINRRGSEGGSDFTTGPMSRALLNDAGVAGTVVLTLDSPANTLVGWSGDLAGEARALKGDYVLIMPASGDEYFGIGQTSPASIEISGLRVSTEYVVTMYHGHNVAERGLDILVNGVLFSLNGATARAVTELVTSDGTGKIIGTAAYVGPEGNWAGMQIDFIDEATDPFPVNEAIGVPLDVTLTWTPGVDAIQSKVYLDPNINDLLLIDTIDIANPQETSPAGLVRDETYYWRVDTVTASGTVTGDVWEFDTVLSTPEIITQPLPVLVDEGASASFTVVAENPFTGNADGLSYQWYKITGTVDPVGTDSATYAIAEAALSDEANYYCKVTIIASGAFTESDTVNLSSKRIMGYWPLDGNADDASGNGWNSINPDSSNTWSPGVTGDPCDLAADFDVSDPNDYINVGNVPVALSGKMTVSLWVKARNLEDNWRGFISKWDDVDPGLHTFWIGQHSGYGELAFSTYLPDETQSVAYNVLPEEPTWVYVVCTFDGALQQIYINGLLNNSDEVSAELPVLDGDLKFGVLLPKDEVGNPSVIGGYFNGLVDEVTIYNYIRTATEIATGYSDVAGPFCAVKPAYDYDDDCQVSFADFAMFAAAWVECGTFPTCITSLD